MLVPSIITADEAKIWLGSPPIDNDAAFTNTVNAANSAVTAVLQWDPTSQLRTEYYSGRGGPALTPNAAPITGLTSISIFLGVNSAALPVDVTQCIIDRWQIIWRGGAFPVGQKNITLVYTAGYLPTSAEMQAIRQATFQTMKAMWVGRGADQNASSESFPGVLSQGFWAGGPGQVPPQARALLSPYCLKMIAG
jgi:hypothetical protein